MKRGAARNRGASGNACQGVNWRHPKPRDQSMPNETLYEIDFVAWTEQQAEALRRAARDRANAPLDWENLAEEIESLGRSDRREAESHVENIVAHLLKLGCSPADWPRAKWKRETDGFRRQLSRVLRDSPSLRGKLPEMIAEAWPAALRELEMGLRDRKEFDASAPHVALFRLKGGFSPDELLADRAYTSRGSTRLAEDAD